MSKRKKPEPMQVILVSYVPLLMGEAGRSDWDPKQVQEAMEEGPSGLADACVWLQDDEGRLGPCLLLPQAAAIADHLKAWAEDRPEEWFQLCAAEHGPLYGLALMPRLDKGIERLRTAYQLRHGLPLPKDIRVTALFKPLHFSSKPGHMFGQVKAHLGDRVRLAVMDSGLVDPANPRGAPWDKAIELGRFELACGEPECGYIEEQLKEQLKGE